MERAVAGCFAAARGHDQRWRPVTVGRLVADTPTMWTSLHLNARSSFDYVDHLAIRSAD
jgi:hypothetical protein